MTTTPSEPVLETDENEPPAHHGTLKAPFPYFGGKTTIASEVWERFGNPDLYVEPFGGSLAVLLARPRSHTWWNRKETVGDFSGHIVNFYRAVAADPDAVAEAANWPVTEADLTARHLYLVRYQNTLAEQLAADPFFYDVQAAGWWVWGISAWVGGEWCSGLGPWKPGDPTGPGVYRKMPMVAGNHGGKGIHRPLSLPMSDGSDTFVTDEYGKYLKQQFKALSDRLRRTRIVCGDWTRMTRSVVEPNGAETVAIFLDPPYDLDLRRGDLYGPADRSGRSSVDANNGTLDLGIETVEDMQVHEQARTWAISVGDRPNTRVAYCSYSTPEEDAIFEKAGWTAYRWTAKGGYGLQSNREARDNRDKEIVWFSPNCISPDADDLFSSLAESPEGTFL